MNSLSKYVVYYLWKYNWIYNSQNRPRVERFKGLLLITLVIISIVDSSEESGRLLGDRLDNGGAVGGNAAILEELPELLGMFHGFHFCLITMTGSLEHKELAKELVSVGDAIGALVALGKFLNGSGTDSWYLAQVSSDLTLSPGIHGVITDFGSAWVIAISLVEYMKVANGQTRFGLKLPRLNNDIA